MAKLLFFETHCWKWGMLDSPSVSYPSLPRTHSACVFGSYVYVRDAWPQWHRSPLIPTPSQLGACVLITGGSTTFLRMTRGLFELFDSAVMEENWGVCGVQIWRKVKNFSPHPTPQLSCSNPVIQSPHNPSATSTATEGETSPSDIHNPTTLSATLPPTISAAAIDTPTHVNTYQLRPDDIVGKFLVGESVKASSTGRIDEGNQLWNAHVRADLGNGRYCIEYSCDKKIYNGVPASWITKII